MSALPIDHPVVPLPGRTPGLTTEAAVIQLPAGRTSTVPCSRTRHALRITRRARLLLTTIALAGVLAPVGVLVGDIALAGGGSVPEPTRQVVVMPGQTLNQVAATVPGDADVRDVAAQIRELNGLETSGLLAGQELRVPLDAG